MTDSPSHPLTQATAGCSPPHLIKFALTAVPTLILLLFTLRRWLFLLAALWPRRKRVVINQPITPPVLLLVPTYNEAQNLPGLLTAVSQLHYPTDKLTVVLIDDGSTDNTYAIMHRWAQGYDNWSAMRLWPNRGKAEALNVALAYYSNRGDAETQRDRGREGEGENLQSSNLQPSTHLIAVYDADERPLPYTLTQLVQSFTDPTIGAVNGRRTVSNPLASLIATHSAFENLVHEQITMRGKARLNLAPAILGANCVYRRQALEAVGGFKPGALLEDSDLTLRLVRAGWRTDFVETAVSTHAVPTTLTDYWAQHTRWVQGFQDVATSEGKKVMKNGRLPLLLRLELLFFSLGYLDRLAWLVTGGWQLAVGSWCRKQGEGNQRSLGTGGQGDTNNVSRITHHASRITFYASLLTPLFQVIAALKLSRAPRQMWWRVPLLPLFLLLDMVIAAVGIWRSFKGR